MKLYINEKRYEYDYLEVDIDRYDLIRTFELEYIFKDDNLFNHGDKVVIHDVNDKILLEGKIEFIEADLNKVTYIGRDGLGILADSYISKPIQFNKNTSLDTILKKVLNGLNIKVSGTTAGLEKTGLYLAPGLTISDSIRNLSKYYGTLLVGNGIDTIQISEEPEQGAFNLEYGKNLRYRLYSNNSIGYYDKYTVLGLYIQDSYGDGNKEKVFDSGLNLSKKECNKIAKFFYSINIGKNIKYICDVYSDQDIEINKKYNVKDTKFSINQDMVVSKLTYTKSKDQDNLRVYLEGSI